MLCTYNKYINLSTEEKKCYTRTFKDRSKNVIKCYKLIAKLLNKYKEFTTVNSTKFYMECAKLKLEKKNRMGYYM